MTEAAMLNVFTNNSKSRSINNHIKKLSKNKIKSNETSFSEAFSKLSNNTHNKSKNVNIRSKKESINLENKITFNKKSKEVIKNLLNKGKKPLEILTLFFSFSRNKLDESENKELNNLLSKLNEIEISELKVEIEGFFEDVDLESKKSQDAINSSSSLNYLRSSSDSFSKAEDLISKILTQAKFTEVEQNKLNTIFNKLSLSKENKLLIIADKLSINPAKDFNLSESKFASMINNLVEDYSDKNTNHEEKLNKLYSFLNNKNDELNLFKETDFNDFNLANLESNKLESVNNSKQIFILDENKLDKNNLKYSVQKLNDLLSKLELEFGENKLTNLEKSEKVLKDIDFEALTSTDKNELLQAVDQIINNLLSDLNSNGYSQGEIADKNLGNIKDKLNSMLSSDDKVEPFNSSQSFSKHLNSLSDIFSDLKAVEPKLSPEIQESLNLEEVEMTMDPKVSENSADLVSDNHILKSDFELLFDQNQKNEASLSFNNSDDSLVQQFHIMGNQTNELQVENNFAFNNSESIYSEVDLYSQIVEKFEGSYSADQKQLQIQLEPEFLGKIDVSLSYDNDKMVGKMIVESEVIRSQLDNMLSNLKNDLVKQGINIEQFKIETAKNTPQQVEKNNDFFLNDQQSAFSDGDSGHNQEYDQRRFFQGLYYVNQDQKSILDERDMLNQIQLNKIKFNARDSIDLLA